QLRLDEDLRRTVQAVTAGAPDVATKVERLFAWVVEHTRYVALEFGIHGYKPYHVTQVARRGFGDCKDKASLLYAMLQEAGIEAEIVLVRTRRGGQMASVPASPAVFDHAIAYVPQLKRYLDATVEHSGSLDLPPDDQGVMVLHVGPHGARLAQTPLAPAAQSTERLDLQLTLRPDAALQVQGDLHVSGWPASQYRGRLLVEGKRQTALQALLQGRFPGLRLQALSRTQLMPRDKAVALRFQATVPAAGPADGRSLTLTSLGQVLLGTAATSTRRHALDLGFRRCWQEHRRFTVTGWRVAQLPKAVTLDSPFGRFILQAERTQSGVTLHSELVLRVAQVPASRYAAYRRWVQRIAAAARPRLRLTRTEAKR
ncbi:MAG: transglutaminase-like domain-containing protein, partial [Polyangiales bacterium]